MEKKAYFLTIKAREVKRTPMTRRMYGPWLSTSHRPCLRVRGLDVLCLIP